MADYYTQFSAVIPMGRATAEEVIELLEAADQWDDEGKAAGPLANVFPDGYIGFEYELDDEGLLVYTSESGEPQHVADLVAHLIAAGIVHLSEPFKMEWANTCYRPVLDAFGGGALIVYPDGTDEWINTSDWVWDKEKAWTSKQPG